MDYRGRQTAGDGNNAGYDDRYMSSSSNAPSQHHDPMNAASQFDQSGYAPYGHQHAQQQYADPTLHHHQQHYYGGDPSQQHASQHYNDVYSMDPSEHQHYYGDPSHQQQQQQYYEDPSQHHQQQAYYNDMGGGDWNIGLHSQHQGMMMMTHPDAAVRTWPGGGAMETQQHTAASTAVEKGSYYQEAEFLPELLYGRAVGALAIDPSYECMYVAGATRGISTTRFNAHRASLLMTYTTPNLSSPMSGVGESLLYSSVAGHPEASSSTLQAIYTSIYGISKVLSTPQTGRNHPPSHAYLPPYGGGELSETSVAPHMMYPGAMHPQHQQSQQPGHMGITELLPLGNGYVGSVSPAAVRIHSYGGLQLNDYVVDGMLCGTVHPHSGPGGVTHVSVGGLSTAAVAETSKSSAESMSERQHQKDHSNIHCLDLWQGLRPVYSRSFKDQSSTEGPIAVTALATSHERGSLVAGCSDGNIRMLDGSLREVATVKSHLGGVSSVSVSPDGYLIATTGFSSKGRPTTEGGASSALYAFPDPKAYIYDIRYLGRGGIPHPFAGVKGAPRFARFIPDIDGCASNRFLLASGKPGGGMQILTPFKEQDGKTTGFLLPQLQQGESMTAFSSPVDDGDELAIGTSLGRVLRYRLSGFDDCQRKAKAIEGASSSSWSRQSNASSIVSTSKSFQSESKAPRKEALEIPPFGPPAPALSLDPTLLQGDPNLRNGTTEEMRSIFGTYTLVVSRNEQNAAKKIHLDERCFFLIMVLAGFSRLEIRLIQ